MRKRMKTSSGIVNGFAPAFAIGALLCAAGGCESGAARSGSDRGGGVPVEPVNTGLNALGSESEVQLPEDPYITDREPGMAVTDQIAESARQLNVYFDQMNKDDGTAGDDEGEDYQLEEPGLSGGMPDFQLEAELAKKLGGESAPDLVTDLAPDLSPDPSAAEVQTPNPIIESEHDSVDQGQSEPEAVDTDSDSGDGVRVSLLGAGVPVEPNGVEGEDAAIEPMDRKQELARELGQILAELASTSDDPGAAALALAGLEMVLPGDTSLLVDEGVLSESERASLDAARAFLKTMSSEGSIASPSEVAAGLSQIQTKLGRWAGLSISKAALCTDVYGFGRYETFDSYRFVAGRAQRMVVYIELERFGQREFLGPDGQARFESKLSQRIELYHAADDLNAWNQPIDTVSDVTRNRLRDYYLTNMITLPANLGVGRYHLKVVVRDLVGERGAETIIPIEVVSR